MRAQRRHEDGKPIEDVEREARDKLRENRFQLWMVVLVAPGEARHVSWPAARP